MDVSFAKFWGLGWSVGLMVAIGLSYRHFNPGRCLFVGERLGNCLLLPDT
jgi:hypothetical protein